MPMLWLAAAVLFGLVEAATVALVAVWFIVGALAALVASLAGADFIWQLLIFALVSAVSMGVVRRFFLHRLEIKAVPSTNADQVIGKLAFVVEPIEPPRPGRARVDNLSWSAKSDRPLAAGSYGKIVRIEGASLVLAPVDLKEE